MNPHRVGVYGDYVRKRMYAPSVMSEEPKVYTEDGGERTMYVLFAFMCLWTTSEEGAIRVRNSKLLWHNAVYPWSFT